MVDFYIFILLESIRNTLSILLFVGIFYLSFAEMFLDKNCVYEKLMHLVDFADSSNLHMELSIDSNLR